MNVESESFSCLAGEEGIGNERNSKIPVSWVEWHYVAGDGEVDYVSGVEETNVASCGENHFGYDLSSSDCVAGNVVWEENVSNSVFLVTVTSDENVTSIFYGSGTLTFVGNVTA